MELLNDKKADRQLRKYSVDSLGQITGDKDRYMKIRWEIEEGKR